MHLLNSRVGHVPVQPRSLACWARDSVQAFRGQSSESGPELADAPFLPETPAKGPSRTNKLLSSHWSRRGSAWQERRNLQSPVQFRSDQNVRKFCVPLFSLARLALLPGLRLTTLCSGEPFRSDALGSRRQPSECLPATWWPLVAAVAMNMCTFLHFTTPFHTLPDLGLFEFAEATEAAMSAAAR